MRSALTAAWLVAGFVTPLHAAWVSVGNLTVPARQAFGTPDLPAAPLTLAWGGSGCAPIVSPPALPFALFVERGACSFDAKMAAAVHAGASALVVADSLQGEYHSGANASVPAAAMQLKNPCVVDCSLGRGVASTVGLDSRAVLAGALSGQCGSERGCTSGACAFSGSGLGDEAREVRPAPDSDSDSGPDPDPDPRPTSGWARRHARRAPPRGGSEAERRDALAPRPHASLPHPSPPSPALGRCAASPTSPSTWTCPGRWPTIPRCPHSSSASEMAPGCTTACAPAS